jgi:LmbE family N-acetylglucosaminyl deacetylase
MNIIIAPHVDDELIGCWSLIKKDLIDKVIYVDVTPIRHRYARQVGRELGFSVEIIEFKNLYTFLEKNPSHTYLVPDSSDNHPLHKAVNAIARISGCKLGYYSVDMVASFVRELSEEDKKEKRVMLNKYYPDQSSLWEHDWKYFLFEGVVTEFPLAEGRK